MFRQLSINMSQVKYLYNFPKSWIILSNNLGLSVDNKHCDFFWHNWLGQLVTPSWLLDLYICLFWYLESFHDWIIDWFLDLFGGVFNGEITTVITTLYFQLYTFFNFLDHLSHFCFVSPPFFLNKKIFSQHCSTRFCCPTSGRSFSVHLCRRTLCTEVKASVSVPVYHLFHYWLLLTQVKLVVNIFRSVVRKRSEKKEWWEY